MKVHQGLQAGHAPCPASGQPEARSAARAVARHPKGAPGSVSLQSAPRGRLSAALQGRRSEVSNPSRRRAAARQPLSPSLRGPSLLFPRLRCKFRPHTFSSGRPPAYHFVHAPAGATHPTNSAAQQRSGARLPLSSPARLSLTHAPSSTQASPRARRGKPRPTEEKATPSRGRRRS